MAGNKLMGFKAIIEGPNGTNVGSLSSRPEEDVTLKVSCDAANEIRGALLVKMIVAAPSFMHAKDNRLGIEVRVHNTDLTEHTLQSNIEIDQASEAVRRSHRFIDRIESETGVARLQFTLDPKGVTSKGLNHTIQFTQFDDDTDIGAFIAKPWVQQAIDNLRTIFHEGGKITMYLRDERAPFSGEFQALLARFEQENTEGPVVRHFYDKKFHADTTLIPRIQLGQLSSNPRPNVTTQATYTYTDFVEFFTRHAFGMIQQAEFAEAEVLEFNQAVHKSRFMSIPNSGHVYYLAQLDPNPDVERRLRPGDVVHFKFNLQNNTSDAEWRGEVIPNPPWAHTGEVSLRIKRPYQPAPVEDAHLTGKTTQEYITMTLPCGDGNQKTDEEMQEALESTPRLRVCCRLEYSNVPLKRVIHAMNLLAGAAKQDPQVIAGVRSPWIPCPYLSDLQEFIINRSAIPEGTRDILGAAVSRLEHLDSEDLVKCIAYLQKVPVRHNIALALICGRAGTGKTTFIAQLILAMLEEDIAKPEIEQSVRFLYMAPSNDPTDVGMERIFEYCQAHPVLKDELIVRGHNVVTEKAYVYAHARNEGRKAAEDQDATNRQDPNVATSTTPDVVAPDALGITTMEVQDVAIPEVHDTSTPKTSGTVTSGTSGTITTVLEVSLEESIATQRGIVESLLPSAMVERLIQMLDTLPVESLNPRVGQMKWFFQDCINEGFDTQTINTVSQLVKDTKTMRGVTRNTSETAKDTQETAIPTPDTEGNEVTVVSQCLDALTLANDAVLLPDGTVDLDLADTFVAKALVTMINRTLSPGVALVNDPRFKRVQQSIGFTILAVAGMVTPANKYTDPGRFAQLRTLFERSMEAGDNLDTDDKAALNEQIKQAREYILARAKVVGTTPINACSASYYTAFKPTIVFGDEMNRGILAEFVSVLVHYEAPTIILCGDTRQLKPVVTGPTPLTGFLKEISMSVMEYFEGSYWPKCEIRMQRRSRSGIMDFPTTKYYHDIALNGPQADDDDAHPLTWPALAVINTLIPPTDPAQKSSAVIYLEVIGSTTLCDSVTKSRYNLKFAALAINIITALAADPKISPKDIGVITPYNAQIHIYQYALRQLHVADPMLGYDQITIGTTDSMEGSQAPVVIFDSCVTRDLGFTNDRGRCLVNTTRAVDLSIVIGQPSTLMSPPYCDAEIVALFKLAGDKGIVRTLESDKSVLQHEHVRARVVMTAENQSAYDDAYTTPVNAGTTSTDLADTTFLVPSDDIEGPAVLDLSADAWGRVTDHLATSEGWATSAVTTVDIPDNTDGGW